MAREALDVENAAAAPVAVETKVADTGTWAKSVEITIPVEEVDREYNSVLGELAGSVRLPGFRPGKVPRAVIEKRFGDDIKKQVTGNLLSRGVRSAIEKEKLSVIGEPHLDPSQYTAEHGKPLTFKLDVEIKPVFEVGAYKGLEIEQEEIELLPDEM